MLLRESGCKFIIDMKKVEYVSRDGKDVIFYYSGGRKVNVSAGNVERAIKVMDTISEYDWSEDKTLVI